MPEPLGGVVVGVAHLQPPGGAGAAGMSPRYGLDGKRAEKGPSIVLPGGLEAGDAAPRTFSVVVALLSVRWSVLDRVVGAARRPIRAEVLDGGGELGVVVVGQGGPAWRRPRSRPASCGR